jgi:hypothetical protein
MLTLRDAVVQEDYYQDRMRVMREERITRQRLMGSEDSIPFYSGVLMWLGHRLVVWGRNLQERYGTATPAPMPRPVNRLAS